MLFVHRSNVSPVAFSGSEGAPPCAALAMPQRLRGLVVGRRAWAPPVRYLTFREWHDASNSSKSWHIGDTLSEQSAAQTLVDSHDPLLWGQFFGPEARVFAGGFLDGNDGYGPRPSLRVLVRLAFHVGRHGGQTRSIDDSHQGLRISRPPSPFYPTVALRHDVGIKSLVDALKCPGSFHDACSST